LAVFLTRNAQRKNLVSIVFVEARAIVDQMRIAASKSTNQCALVNKATMEIPKSVVSRLDAVQMTNALVNTHVLIGNVYQFVMSTAVEPTQNVLELTIELVVNVYQDTAATRKTSVSNSNVEAIPNVLWTKLASTTNAIILAKKLHDATSMRSVQSIITDPNALVLLVS
jgi:hypothetical protein